MTNMISGFCCEVAENCILLAYYAASSGNFHYLLRNNPEDTVLKYDQLLKELTKVHGLVLI